jgi:hypothetical protein
MDTTLQTQTKMTPSALLTSVLTPYSEDSQNRSKANTKSPTQSPSNTGSRSLTKKGKITASGDRSTEVLMTENPWHKHSNLVATKETPQILTLTSQETKPRNKKNTPLLHWLNSFLHTLPNPSSIPSTDYLCWLLECHKSQQLPLSLQQAHWDKLLELVYPQEAVPQPTLSETYLAEEEDLEEDRLMVGALLNETQQTPPIQPGIQELEEGEILQTLEEGEILLMADSPTNF